MEQTNDFGLGSESHPAGALPYSLKYIVTLKAFNGPLVASKMGAGQVGNKC